MFRTGACSRCCRRSRTRACRNGTLPSGRRFPPGLSSRPRARSTSVHVEGPLASGSRKSCGAVRTVGACPAYAAADSSVPRCRGTGTPTILPRSARHELEPSIRQESTRSSKVIQVRSIVAAISTGASCPPSAGPSTAVSRPQVVGRSASKVQPAPPLDLPLRCRSIRLDLGTTREHPARRQVLVERRHRLAAHACSYHCLGDRQRLRNVRSIDS